MISNFLVVVLIVGRTTMCIGAPESGSREVSDRNRDAVLKYLRQVTGSSDIAIRLYYRGACDPKVGDPIPFPFVNVQQPSKGKTGLTALREIFKKDRSVTVTEETGI